MIKRIWCLPPLMALLCYGCAAPQKAERPSIPKVYQNDERRVVHAPARTVQATPEFVPVSEDLSPLKTKIVSISARNTPLKDVLYVVAEATGLNLAMDAGVNPELPVTLMLKNVTAEAALNTIFSSVDYSWSIKGNVLTVMSLETRIFEFGQPSVIQDYSVSVGGDILGAGATATSGSSGSAGAGTGVKGNIVQSVQSDKDASKLWESIEKTIASTIRARIIPSQQQAAATTATTATASSTRIEPQPRLNVNRMTGTIVVTASRKDLDKVAEYLARLKEILGRQVIVEARVVEVQLSDSLKYGIDWSALGSSGNFSLTSSTNRFTDVVSQTSPNFQRGVSGTNFSGLLTALQSQGDLKVLSNPRINIMNGQTAILSVGRNTSFISRVETTTTAGSSVATSATTFTVQTQSVLSGVMIGMAPIVNENGEISMSITPIISDLVKLEDRNVGTIGQNTIQISLPTVDLRELNTTVKIRDGEMVVIGGLIQNRDSLQDNQVPFLGRIPVLGYLFKSREKVKEKTELVIMLKPTVVAF